MLKNEYEIPFWRTLFEMSSENLFYENFDATETRVIVFKRI